MMHLEQQNRCAGRYPAPELVRFAWGTLGATARGGYNINPRLGVAVAASCEGPTRHRSMVFAPDTQTWRGEPEKNDDDDDDDDTILSKHIQ